MAQPNFVTFEVGIRRGARVADGRVTPARVETLAVHTLVVRPQSTSWSDQSRATREQTNEAALVMKGGRQLRSITYQGTFGVETRGFGATIGTGELRRRQFYTEVVRLPDAVSNRQLIRELRDGARSPALLAAIGFDPYQPERGDRLFVNVYDYWHRLRFEGLIRAFNQERSSRYAAASGAIRYTLTVEEVGPPVMDTIAGEVIGLFQNRLGWVSDAVEVLTSFNAAAIAEAVTSPITDAALEAFTGALDVVQSQVRGVRRLLAPGSDPLRAPLVRGYYTALLEARGAARDLRGALRSQPEPTPPPPGVVDFAQVGRVRRFEDAGRVYDAEVALDDQLIAGPLLGLDDQPWFALLEGGVQAQRQAGSTYVVAYGDTGAVVEGRVGVAWGTILEHNGLTDDEALVPGTELEIPAAGREARLAPIEGLPVHGSHSGKKAWGADVTPDLAVKDDGPEVVIDRDVLVQGMQSIIAEVQDRVFEGVNDVPPGQRGDYVVTRFTEAILADPRFVAVMDAQADVDASGAVSMSLEIAAINGGVVRAGSEHA